MVLPKVPAQRTEPRGTRQAAEVIATQPPASADRNATVSPVASGASGSRVIWSPLSAATMCSSSVSPLAAGLAAVRADAPVAYVSSTDVPLLHPRFVRRVLAAVDDGVDVALPQVRGYPQPLAAAYRTALVDVVERLIAEDRMRPAFLFEACRVRRLDEAALLGDPALAALDPALDSVLNLNERTDYEAARARPAPEVTVQRFGALRRLGNGARDPGVVQAATLGEAAAASGLTLDEHIVAALNGDQITRDPQAPLAAGDTVAFMAADAGG